MSKSKHLQRVPKQVQSNTVLAYIALVIASISLIIFLFVDYLGELKKQDLEQVDSFEKAIGLKESLPSQYLSWIYNDYLSERSLQLDMKLLEYSNNNQSLLLKTLSQKPLSFLPMNQAKQSFDWGVYKSECNKIRELIEGDRISPKLKSKFQNLLQKCSSLISGLESWYEVIRQFESTKKLKTREFSSKVFDTQDFTRIKPIQVRALLPLDRGRLQRYTFAWYRQWINNILNKIEAENNQLNQTRRCLDGRELDLCVDELLEEIQSINMLNQKTAELSKDLNELISLRFRRLANLRWRRVWNTYLPEARDKAILKNKEHNHNDLNEHKLMSNLYQIYQIPLVTQILSKEFSDSAQSEQNLKTVHAGIRAQDHRTTSQLKLSIPKDLLIRWKVELNRISYLGFARVLERLGYSHQSNLNDIKQVWFVPLLNSKDQQAILFELKALALRLSLYELFKNPNQIYTEVLIQKLTSQIKALEDALQHNEQWKQRLLIFKSILDQTWHSVQGSVSCQEKEFKLHTQWKDLGLIDRLVPLIYLKSDRDQSILNKRIGRVQWGLPIHHKFYIALYDEDQLTQVDLLFEDKMISVSQLVKGTKIRKHGCVYSVKLLGLEPIRRWLYTD